MATRVVDSNNQDSDISFPSVDIHEVNLGTGTRTRTRVPDESGPIIEDFDIPTATPQERPRKSSTTEVVDYSKLGQPKQAVADATRTRVFLGTGSAPAPTATSAPAPTHSTSGTPATDGGAMSQEDFCVGWVVAISGPMKGRSYVLHAGQNHIGRDAGNAVTLPDDPGISRKAHIIITYDHRHNRYRVFLGSEGRGLADVNGEPLEMPRTLEHGDEILLSDATTLRFIPLCSDSFKW